MHFSNSPYYNHYHYLSDGHRGFRSKKQKVEMAKKAEPVAKAESVLPIKTLSMIVEKEIRNGGQDNEHDSEIISKLFALSWFEEMFAAAKTYYSVMKGENAVERYILLQLNCKRTSDSVK